MAVRAEFLFARLCQPGARLALLWGMTGAVPNLTRLNRQSFRLTNKHVGENAAPSASIVLLHDNGKRLSIHRAYRARPDLETDLTVDIDDKTLAGQQAQELIWAELGLKPQSLEGCGVVLQDHRLALITGKESDISDVINDMLGLLASCDCCSVAGMRSRWLICRTTLRHWSLPCCPGLL